MVSLEVDAVLREVRAAYFAVLGEVRAEMARQRRRRIDIAEATGMSDVKLSRKLNGHTRFTFDELDAVCRALGVPLVDLIRRAETRGGTSTRYTKYSEPDDDVAW